MWLNVLFLKILIFSGNFVYYKSIDFLTMTKPPRNLKKKETKGTQLHKKGTQYPLPHQIHNHWKPFRDLKRTFAVSRRTEQLRLHVYQRIVPTVQESVLRTEMVGLESQDEDDPRYNLWFKSMSWMG